MGMTEKGKDHFVSSEDRKRITQQVILNQIRADVNEMVRCFASDIERGNLPQTITVAAGGMCRHTSADPSSGWRLCPMLSTIEARRKLAKVVTIRLFGPESSDVCIVYMDNRTGTTAEGEFVFHMSIKLVGELIDSLE